MLIHQGPSSLTDFEPLEHVPGLDRGGWYDAGDEDFRVESQSGEIFILSAIYDEFNIQRDKTLINQDLRLVEIREPDFPELKEFPYLWQQAEYVMGGGSGNFMFIGLAAHRLLNE